MKVALRFVVCALFGAIASASGVPVHVLIDFADREDLDITVNYEEVYVLTGVKHPYYVGFWVRGAFETAPQPGTIRFKYEPR